jgi:hypothetical protein
MRLVREPATIAQAIAGARREAKAPLATAP